MFSIVVVLLLMRQGIVLLQKSNTSIQAHSRIIMEKQIDPAALFYTESEQVLNAVKKIQRAMPPN